LVWSSAAIGSAGSSTSTAGRPDEVNERRYDVAARTRQLWVDDIAEFELTLEDVTTQVREDRR
jgi:hypothetical protein